VAIFAFPQTGGVEAWKIVGPWLMSKVMTREREGCHGRADRAAWSLRALAAARPRNDGYWLESVNGRVCRIVDLVLKPGHLLRTEIASTLCSRQRRTLSGGDKPRPYTKSLFRM